MLECRPAPGGLCGSACVVPADDIVGLYLNPPENAVVLSVPTKVGIQALERAQGWLRLPNGRALRGHTHEYKQPRHHPDQSGPPLRCIRDWSIPAITGADGVGSSSTS